MKLKKTISALTSAVFTAALLGGAMPQLKSDNGILGVTVVSAAEAENTEFEADILYLVMDEVDEEGKYCQWYRTNDVTFRNDGINVKLNGKNVTDECIIKFRKNIIPENIYDGMHFDYEIPVDIYYDNGTPVTSELPVKIGQAGDANMDHTVDVRDAALIARNADSQKSLIKDFGRFLATGTRTEKCFVHSSHAMLIAQELAASALERKSNKKVEQVGSGKYSLSVSKANGMPGETVSVQVVVDADDNFESLDAVLRWDNKELGSAAAVAVNGTLCASYRDDGVVSIVDFGAGQITDGAIATIDFTIPENATPGSHFEVYFSDVKNFTVVSGGNNVSEDVKDKVNITGAQISVDNPKHDKPLTTEAPTEPVVTTPVSTEALTTAVTTTVAATEAQTTAPISTATTETQATTVSSQTTVASTTATTAITKATTVLMVNVLRGDANLDGKVDIRDAAYIAIAMATKSKKIVLTLAADFNGDGIVNIRDAAGIAIYRASISRKKR